MRKHGVILFVTALALVAAGIGYWSLEPSISEAKAIEIAKQELNNRERHIPRIISCSRTSNGGLLIIARSEDNIWRLGKPYHESWVTKWHVVIGRAGNMIDYRKESPR